MTSDELIGRVVRAAVLIRTEPNYGDPPKPEDIRQRLIVTHHDRGWTAELRGFFFGGLTPGEGSTEEAALADLLGKVVGVAVDIREHLREMDAWAAKMQAEVEALLP